MSVQKKVCLSDNEGEEKLYVVFVFQALKPFTGDLARIIR